MKVKKKLIEVALPLDAINKGCSLRRSRCAGIGPHPSEACTFGGRVDHWLTARAVIFAQMVDDPSEYVDVLLSDTKKRRACGARAQEARLRHIRRRGSLVHDGAIAEAQLTLEEVIAEQEREPAIRNYRSIGSLGEHHERRGARAGAAGDLAELASCVR